MVKSLTVQVGSTTASASEKTAPSEARATRVLWRSEAQRLPPEAHSDSEPELPLPSQQELAEVWRRESEPQMTKANQQNTTEIVVTSNSDATHQRHIGKDSNVPTMKSILRYFEQWHRVEPLSTTRCHAKRLPPW